jgi:hypothetical protein
MTRRERDIRALVADTGLRLLSLTVTGGGHYRVRVQAADGRTQVFFVSATPSCRRGEKNNAALIRRFALQRDNMNPDYKNICTPLFTTAGV